MSALDTFLEGEEFHSLCMEYRQAPFGKAERLQPQACFKRLQDAIRAASPKGGDGLTEFTAWLEREMPPGTVISNPAWWAPRILLAASRTADKGE